ncbi:MAG: dihydroorotase [Akkermansia sp.]
MSSTFIRNARIATTGDTIDILLSPDGIIEQIGHSGSMKHPEGVSIIDATGDLIIPGLFDLHVHLDQTGHEARECIQTASPAALQGGITGFQVMPDCASTLDNAAQIAAFMDACHQESPLDIVPSGSITKGMLGEEQVSYDSLRAQSVHFITDADHIPENLLLLHRAMQYAGQLGMTFALRGDVPALTAKATIHPGTTAYILGLTGAPSCAEEIGLETVIRLSDDTGNTLHVQTVSTARSANIIHRWKAKGNKMSAEVALHHLIFTHEDVGDYNTTFKTLPPLRDQQDTLALIDAIKDGTIDCIVTDHTPCKPFAKKQDFIMAPQGMIGLDTFLPALHHYLIKQGHLTWTDIVKTCSDKPRQLVGLPPIQLQKGQKANFVLFSPEETTKVTEQFLKSRAKNSPFLDQKLDGKVKSVFLNNSIHQF